MDWRSILGIIIGVLNVIFFFTCTCVAIDSLKALGQFEAHDNDQERIMAIGKTALIIVLVISLIMTLIAGLLILGIVKRRHKLMIPWLVLSGIGFIGNCGRCIFAFFYAIYIGAPFTAIFLILIASAFSIGIPGIILWFIYKLYGDIRKGNIEKPGNVMAGAQYKM